VRLRELAGEINRAREVYVWVPYGAEGLWLSVTKPAAKRVLDDARDKGLAEVEAEVSRGVVKIGVEIIDGEAEDAASEGDEGDEGEDDEGDEASETPEEEDDEDD